MAQSACMHVCTVLARVRSCGEFTGTVHVLKIQHTPLNHGPSNVIIK